MARTKGAKNVLSKTAKENIAAVFVRLGGTAGMAMWAKDNQTEFYRIYSKLIAVELVGADGAALNFTLLVPPKADGG